MKVVFDTNVLISSFFWHGPPHNLLILIEKGDLTLCTTPLLLEELRDVLKRPFFSPFIARHKTSCEELIAAIFEIAELYPDKRIEPVVKNDPDDDKVLSCALVSGAKYIITGDLHLLNLINLSCQQNRPCDTLEPSLRHVEPSLRHVEPSLRHVKTLKLQKNLSIAK